MLTIAGSDSSGGAGIQADLKTFEALGCYGMSVVTAITAQNSCGVFGVEPVSAKMVAQQLRAVLEDMGVDAIKISMLVNTSILNTVRDILKRYPRLPMVLDPILRSSSGYCLLDVEAQEPLKGLFSLVKLLTPNLSEASELLQRPIFTELDMEAAGHDLLKLGPEAVLVKGGHLQTSPGSDCLVLKDSSPIWFRGENVDTKNTHGTGCTYASAIAAYLAKGKPVEEAIRSAKEYIQQAIAAGAHYRIGNGHGPVKHDWNRQKQ